MYDMDQAGRMDGATHIQPEYASSGNQHSTHPGISAAESRLPVEQLLMAGRHHGDPSASIVLHGMGAESAFPAKIKLENK